MPVKQEASQVDAERQAKIKAMAARIRQEAQEAAAGGGGGAKSSGPTPPSTAPPAPQSSIRPSTSSASARKPAPSISPSPSAGSGTGVKRKAPELSETEMQKKEEEDGQKIEKFLPLLEEKVSSAEDEAEKVAILAAPLCMDADDEIRDLQLAAVRDTERAVRAASAVVAASTREVERRLTETLAMAPNAKETGEAELEKLKSRLVAAQAKLDEYKTVRKDHEAAIAAGKAFGELSQRTASLEIDCEKAAMMAEPIQKAVDEASASDVSPTELRETKEALRIAQATLAPTMRLLQGKIEGLKGPMKSKLLELQARTEASQSLIDKAQKTVEECQAKSAAVPILKQANERLEAVEDVMERMRETESPFLMGLETMPADESSDLISIMEKAASLAHSSIVDGHKYISLKMVEIARLGEAGESVKAEIERIKAKLDKEMEGVKKFQADTQKRKRMAIVDGIKGLIDAAQKATDRLKDLGIKLANADADESIEILENGLAAEVEAEKAITAARRELGEKQQDLRHPKQGERPDALKSNSDVLKTKVKVNYMEAELVKFRKIAKEVEEKQKVEQSLGEVHTRLNAAEMEIGALETASQAWPKGEKPPDGEEKRILEVQSKLTSTTVEVEKKLQSAQGLELKQLRSIFGRLQRTQYKLDRIKEKVKELTRSISQKVIKGAVDIVSKAAKLVDALGPASSSTTMDFSKLEAWNEKAREAREAVSEAQKYLSDVQSSGQLGLDAKVEFARLQLRWKATERKARTVSEALTSKIASAKNEACGKALDVLQAAATKDGVLDADSLFSVMADGSEEILLKAFQDFFSIRAPDVTAEQAALAFKTIAPQGLSRRVLAAALRRFLCCVKEISITDCCEIAAAKKVKVGEKVRKLEVGEVVEALGPPQTDSLGLERVECRVLRDGSVGWVTIKSKSGTLYMERAARPYLWCSETLPLYAEKSVGSRKLREVCPGEVLELIQGPEEDSLHGDQRVRGMACHEGTQGWLQIRDKSGSALAKQSARVFKCVEAIAMTDVSDFDNCNMIRRIEANEALEVLPDPAVVPEEGGLRKRFRACRDGKEGWITTEGSQGTVYVKPAPKHFICSQAAPLHAGLGAESSVVRVLMPGEAFAAFEEPKDVAGAAAQIAYRAKSLLGDDSVEGWLFSEASPAQVRPWVSRYRVLKAVPLSKSLAHNEAVEVISVIRLLEPDEILDLPEPPVEDLSTGQLRARIVAKKDNATGWVTVLEGKTAETMLITPVFDDVSAATLASAPATPPDDGPGKGIKRSFEDRGDKGNGKHHKGKGKGKW